jgi:hypothetical protein
MKSDFDLELERIGAEIEEKAIKTAENTIKQQLRAIGELQDVKAVIQSWLSEVGLWLMASPSGSHYWDVFEPAAKDDPLGLYPTYEIALHEALKLVAQRIAAKASAPTVVADEVGKGE